MTADEINERMSESEFKNVRIIDCDGNYIEGYVELYESRCDNEFDEPYAWESSICLYTKNDALLLYESMIRHIEIL